MTTPSSKSAISESIIRRDPLSRYEEVRRDSNSSVETAVDPSMSMRTFVQFDSPPPSDDEQSSDEEGRSPSSETANTPPSSGTRWIRFFPELSSHFSLTSPPNSSAKQFTPLSPANEVPHVERERPNTSPASAQTRPSLSSIEIIDDSSSCYSQRTSLTSASSEYTKDFPFGRWRSTCKSADAFSIISPAAAGVFDDTSSVRRFPSSPKSKASSLEKNKPLPETPPPPLAPLAVGQNALRSPARGSVSASSAHSNQIQSPQSSQGPSFTQAAEELEDALAGFTARNGPSPKAMQILNGPLQISRGNMDMIATRPAPRPPVSTHQRESKSLSRVLNRQPIEKNDMVVGSKQTKKAGKHKGPFSFSVPGFGRKNGHQRLHLRSFSSSNMRSEMESQPHREVQTPDIIEETKENSPTSPGSSDASRRPSSLGSERELRQQLPRLQTKKMQPVSQVSHLTPTSYNDCILGENHSQVVGGSPLKEKIDTCKERVFVSSGQMRRSNTFVLPYQLGSLQAPEVIYELDANSSFGPTTKMGKFPSPAPESMILSILNHSNSLDDLFNFAIINGSFYRFFKKHELRLIKNALFDMSPPAWELREMSPPWDAEWQTLLDPDAPVPEYTPTLYLQRYAQDIFALAQLKSLILARCATFLRQDTIRGLAGLDTSRATQVDEAFWRIWTFCRIFGSGKNREDKLEAQADWLNGGAMASGFRSPETTSVAAPFSVNNALFEPPAGFGRGNPAGLSQSQLYDMTEIWTCLSVLLQPIHGKCAEAREVGIFEGFEIPDGDNTKEEEILGSSYLLPFF